MSFKSSPGSRGYGERESSADCTESMEPILPLDVDVRRMLLTKLVSKHTWSLRWPTLE